VVKVKKDKAKAKHAFSLPYPAVGELVWAQLVGSRRVQGTLVRRTKKLIVIHPEGGVDISIEKPA
jgi:hypothetical protein